MCDPAFALPEKMRQALAGLTEGLSFSGATWGVSFPELDDLARLPPDAEFVAVAREPRHIEQLRRAAGLIAVKAYPTSNMLIRELAHLRSLRMATLIDVESTDQEFRGLSKCLSLQHLSILYAKNLTDLGSLRSLIELQTLYIHSVPGLDYATLTELASLKELIVDGGVHATLKLPTLLPFGKLVGLRRLELLNVGAIDGSLKPLAALRQLESVFLSAREFEVEEYARLAAALPETEGRCLRPFWESNQDASGVPVLPCPRCGEAQVFFNGKGTRRSCRKCNAPYLAKLMARWNDGLRSTW